MTDTLELAREAYYNQIRSTFHPLFDVEGWEYNYCEERVYVFREIGRDALYISEGGSPLKAFLKMNITRKNVKIEEV
ncbi:hypothetical protein [Streptococcus sp. S784/96/1]|uniref:hypothetical protein n=1 Tax=Streptococcus sp. S784/96/1 TaxID=2653499 RepID=UPI001387410A|nr:hypothetical protein [Streptococcus sp. S784/96/1]